MQHALNGLYCDIISGIDVLPLLSVYLHGVILTFMVPSTARHLEGEKGTANELNGGK